MVQFAVHNIHVKALKVSDEGKHPNGFNLPDALFTAPTFQEAEDWRLSYRERTGRTHVPDLRAAMGE